MTTTQLAAKYKTTAQTIRQAKYTHGHYKGYVVSGRNGKENLWSAA
tara:strand:- start:3377 stop:3514 length:138 start_codon:yes stop_codon:yes gene_type:complete